MEKLMNLLDEIEDVFGWIYDTKLSFLAKAVMYSIIGLEFVLPMLGVKFGFMSNWVALVLEFDASVKSGLILNHLMK